MPFKCAQISEGDIEFDGILKIKGLIVCKNVIIGSPCLHGITISTEI